MSAIGEIGTPERPLQFLHIPKTAGSSLTRLLEDAFPAGRVCGATSPAELAAIPDDELRGYGVFRGHLGLGLAPRLPVAPTIITVLREPVARVWSHYRATQQRLGVETGGLSFRDYSMQARYQVAEHQARWLAEAPRRRRRSLTRRSSRGYAVARRYPAGDPSLERAARATLEAIALAGTTDRLDDFVVALSRLLGRWLPEPVRINVGGDHRPPLSEESAEVLRCNRIDLALHARAGELLDRALVVLPTLPPPPLLTASLALGMDEAFTGTGWHARHNTEAGGWHRWTGPGVVSVVRLPARFAGPARLDVHVVSASADDAVRSLRLRVQGRAVTHRLETRRVGVGVLADVEFDPELPVELEFEIDRTRRMIDPLGGRPSDLAGLAVGAIAVKSGGNPA